MLNRIRRHESCEISRGQKVLLDGYWNAWRIAVSATALSMTILAVASRVSAQAIGGQPKQPNPAEIADPAVPFLGSWAFALPDGNPVWLNLELSDASRMTGSLLWSVGSARPVQDLALIDGQLSFARTIRWQPFGDSADVRRINEPFSATLSDGQLRLSFTQFKESDPNSFERLTLMGKRMPPLPPAPDLSRVKFGEAIALFDGRSLEGWHLSNARKKNGWRIESGVLINETPKTDFGAYGDYGNLVSDSVFNDFRLTIEYNVEPGANSGVYLRGMYEAQVVDRDSRMQGINGPGAIFGRITPSSNAGRPGGQWNEYVLTLVDRHISVQLNGQKVINNQPIIGCTGGGISADDTRPGPILLQGDHTSVRFRNIRLEPVQ